MNVISEIGTEGTKVWGPMGPPDRKAGAFWQGTTQAAGEKLHQYSHQRPAAAIWELTPVQTQQRSSSAVLIHQTSIEYSTSMCINVSES